MIQPRLPNWWVWKRKKYSVKEQQIEKTGSDQYPELQLPPEINLLLASFMWKIPLNKLQNIIRETAEKAKRRQDGHVFFNSKNDK